MGHPDAQKAVQEAKEHLATVKARTPEVHAIAEASKELRRKNHFAIDLQTMFEGGHRP
jgi:hypothetical protein